MRGEGAGCAVGRGAESNIQSQLQQHEAAVVRRLDA